MYKLTSLLVVLHLGRKCAKPETTVRDGVLALADARPFNFLMSLICCMYFSSFTSAFVPKPNQTNIWEP